MTRTLSCCSALLVLAALTGCEALRQAQPPLEAKPIVANVGQTLLQRWVSGAAEPRIVTCEIDPSVAPDVAARFTALAKRVHEIYAAIYADAGRVAEGGMPKIDLPAGTGDWRAAAQSAITARYQEAMCEIEDARKDLSAFVDTLGDYASITNNVQSTTLRKSLGQGTTQLETLLDAAAVAAKLMREQCLANTSAQ